MKLLEIIWTISKLDIHLQSMIKMIKNISCLEFESIKIFNSLSTFCDMIDFLTFYMLWSLYHIFCVWVFMWIKGLNICFYLTILLIEDKQYIWNDYVASHLNEIHGGRLIISWKCSLNCWYSCCCCCCCCCFICSFYK